MSKLIAMAFPVLPGKEQELRAFTDELNHGKREAYVRARKQMGVHERAFLQKTPMGELVIVTMEGDQLDNLMSRGIEPNDEFSKWFLERVKSIHGVDLSQPPSVDAMAQLIVDSEA